MKHLESYILIVFLISISPKIMSQNIIGVIEVNNIYNDLYEKPFIDSILVELKTSINEVQKKIQHEFHSIYSETINSNICHTVESHKRLEERFEKIQLQLGEYQKYYLDTLKLLSNEILIEFEKYIYAEVENYVKENKLKLVIEKNKLLYYDKSSDITQIIIKRFEQKQNREDDFLDLLEQIDRLLIKYNFEERVNEILIIE